MPQTFEKFSNQREKKTTNIESPEFKEALRKLENDPISPIDKLLIIATALDLKPASSFSYVGTDEQKDRLMQTISELGLLHKENKELNQGGPDEQGRKYTYFDVAKAPERFLSLPSKKTTEDDIRYGRAMGFPESAIQAYSEARKSENIDASGLLLPMEDYEMYLTEEERAFVFFRLSKENWLEEIEWIKQIITEIKKHSPEIYKQVVERVKQ